MPSELDITALCNLALDYLDEAPLTSIDEGTSVARWFKRNFWPLVDGLTRKHPWNFALARVLLPANSTSPPFGWAYAYTLPSDCLRVLPLSDDGIDAGSPIAFKVEKADIVTDRPPPLALRYIARTRNPGLFDNQFCDALAALLAQKAAHFITGKQSYAQAMAQMYQGLLNDAQMIDALEGTPDGPLDDDWLNARL